MTTNISTLEYLAKATRAKRLSRDYLEQVLAAAKGQLPERVIRRLHELAMPSSGGKAKARRRRESELMQKHNPPVVFITGPASDVEKARGVPLAGRARVVFRKLYLDRLGLEEDGTIVLHCDQADFVEVAKSTGGDVVVALGKAAKRALLAAGIEATFLPHPVAVMRKGDSGELTRKLRRIRTELTKADWTAAFVNDLPDEAFAVILPGGEKDDTGRTVPRSLRLLPHHVAGVVDSSDNATVDLPHLRNARARLEQTDAPADVKARAKGHLDAHWEAYLDERGDTAEKQWSGGKAVTAEGEEVDLSEAKVGVKWDGYAEVLLEKSSSTGLTGRLELYYVEDNWLIQKPDAEAPIADTEPVANVLTKLRKDRVKTLHWARPGGTHRVIDVRTGRETGHHRPVAIAKTDAARQLVTGPVLDPYTVDAHDDWIPPAEIELTAHRWMAGSRVIGFGHLEKAEATPVESYLFPYPTEEDRQKADRGEAHKAYEFKFGDETVHSGTWILTTKVNDGKLWAMVEKGEINAYSIGGSGVRVEATLASMPSVQFVPMRTTL